MWGNATTEDNNFNNKNNNNVSNEIFKLKLDIKNILIIFSVTLLLNLTPTIILII